VDILSVNQFDLNFINDIFARATFWSYENFNHKPLDGKILANLFYEPSTRTSSSFFSAMTKLGGSVIPINEVKYSSVAKGENLEDTVRTLECYSDVIVLRHSEVGSARRAADFCSIPIINAGDGIGEHPTQALLDLYTINKELGGINGANIVMVGDLLHGRTVHSLVKLLRLYDVKISFVAPPPLQIPDEYILEGETKHDNLLEVINTADVVYMTRVQAERLNEEHSKINYDYAINKRHMLLAKDSMILMHPLPRVTEIPAFIDDDKRACYFRQMKNGLYIRMALLEKVLT
jgi:aspartate carbamoyltransferase